jgi:hypothetical protein
MQSRGDRTHGLAGSLSEARSTHQAGSLMPRPKSDNFVAFKCPSELRDDALRLAQRTGKTESEIWKEAMEFRLSFIMMVMAGFWDLRTLMPQLLDKPGSTLGAQV